MQAEDTVLAYYCGAKSPKGFFFEKSLFNSVVVHKFYFLVWDCIEIIYKVEISS